MNLRDIFGSAVPWIARSNQTESFEAVRLPRDERPHRSRMEWWHFMGYVEPRPTQKEEDVAKDVKLLEARNGTLSDTDARELAENNSRLDKLRAERHAKRMTFVMSILRGQILQVSQMASIVILTDHERKTYTTNMRLGAMQSSYFELQDGRAFRFHFGARGPSRPGPPDAWSATGGMGVYTLAIDTAKQLSLELTQSTPAVFLDEQGLFHYGNADEDPRTMAYYLWPQLDVVGIQGVGAEEEAVVGQAWMEHQWGDVPIGDYRWRYLAIIIEKGEHAGRWLFFSTQARETNPRRETRDSNDAAQVDWEAFWIKPDGRVLHLDASNVTMMEKNVDVYPLVVGIKVEPRQNDSMKQVRSRRSKRKPSPKSSDSATDLQFEWVIEPIHLRQECRSNLPGGLIPPFWEGACDVYCADNCEKAEKIGWAVMELAGYR